MEVGERKDVNSLIDWQQEKVEQSPLTGQRAARSSVKVFDDLVQ